MMKFSNLTKTLLQEYKNFRVEKRSDFQIDLTSTEKDILNQLQVTGFATVENYYDEITCIKIRQEIDRIIEFHKDELQVDETGSDHRIFGADRVSDYINKFYSDSFINRIIYSHEQNDKLNGCTLAARMDYMPQNLGSGGGWHRDRADCKQTKAILYLSDVSNSHGPFQFIEGSHTSNSIIKSLWKYNFSFNQTRFNQADMDNLINQDSDKLKTFTGKAGTLIFVNTRGLHRGMPIQTGNRYALTSYNWPHEIPSSILSLFIK